MGEKNEMRRVITYPFLAGLLFSCPVLGRLISVEMKLDVTVPWDTTVLCACSMGNASFANEHNNAKDYSSRRGRCVK